MEKLAEGNYAGNIAKIVKGSFISIITTLVLLIAFASILTYSNVGEETIFPVMTGITVVSILLGSGTIAFSIKKKGIIYGGMIGFVYMLLLYILSSLLGAGFAIGINSIIMIILAILAGMIGGIIGVNIGK